MLIGWVMKSRFARRCIYSPSPQRKSPPFQTIDAVSLPVCVETTAMGAAYLAGLAVGYWKSKADVINNWAIDKVFGPKITPVERDKKIAGWNKAVGRSCDWAREE